jgi:hypothetical protein
MSDIYILFLYIYRNSDTENNFSLFKTDAVDLRRLLCEKVVCLIINFITIINIDTPTWPFPQIQMYPKTQNAYGMCYLHTTKIFLPTLF